MDWFSFALGALMASSLFAVLHGVSGSLTHSLVVEQKKFIDALKDLL